MSFHKEVLEGINAFTAMRNSMKNDAHEAYYDWKMRSDPEYMRQQAAQQAADRIRAEGGQVPFGAPGPRTFWDRLAGRPMGTATAITTTALPTPSGTITEDWGTNQRLSKGGRVRGRNRPMPRFQGGGVADPLADAVNDQLPPPGEEPVPAAVQLGMEIAKERAAKAWAARREAERAQGLAQPGPDEGPSPMAFQAIDPLNDQLNRAPPQPAVPGPEAELMHRGELDRINRARQTDQLNRDLPPSDYPPLSPVEQRAIATRGRQEAAQAEEAATTRARAMAGADESVSPFTPERSTSAIGRVTSGVLGSKEENDLQKQIYDLYAEKNEISPGWFTPTTATERKNVRTRQRQIDKEIAKKQKELDKIKGKRVEAELPDEPDIEEAPVAVDTGGMRRPGVPQRPVTTTVTPPPQVAQGSGGQPVLPPYEVDPRLGVPNPRTGPAAAGPGGQPPQGGPGQPPTPPVVPPPAAVTPTGGGQAAPAAPPSGAGPGTRAQPGQQRIEAFDPRIDRVDPTTGRTMDRTLNAQGQPVLPPPELAAGAQQAVDKALAGAAHFGKWIAGDKPGGQIALRSHAGAMPPEVAANIYQAWGEGGRLNPAQAMTRYMVYQYEALSGRGQSALANQMAFEVVQRLGLEASRYADQAVQMVRSGNVQGGASLLAKAHMFTPDGRELRLSKDGRQIVVVNEITGQPVGNPFPVTPQFVLAASMGLRDGSGLWNHLLQRANLHLASMKGTDKDAEGRSIRNENNRMRGELLRRKLAGGGGGGGGGTDAKLDEFNQLTLGKGTPDEKKQTIIVQGGGDGIGADDLPTGDIV